jgi:hypothetical protein
MDFFMFVVVIVVFFVGIRVGQHIANKDYE